MKDPFKNQGGGLKHPYRTIFFLGLFTLAAILLLSRYWTLMVQNPEIPDTVPVELSLERGQIRDRNGRILALQTRLANISLWRPQIQDLEILSRELDPILGIPGEELKERILSSRSDFLYLKKQVDESTIKIIDDRIREGRLRGVKIEPVVRRIYPERNLASQIIGFMGNDGEGLGGIEYAFNRELSPTQGNSSGSTVYLTIDSNVQFILERIASSALQENQAEAVMLMAMDPRTGDVLGSASLPGFDPNDIRFTSNEERMDRPALWAYEPGSVFKIFSMASLLDSGAIGEESVFICNGTYEKTTGRGEIIRINCLGAHGRVRAREIIIYSCNAGAGYAADRTANTRFYDQLRDFGFGMRTGAGNPGETAGFLRPADRWSDRSKPTIAMGQEIAVSAMQMIQAAGVIANDGILVPARVVSHSVSPEGREIPFESGRPRRVLKQESARALRSYMVDVTSGIGTGWRANVEDLSLAVKTGTAQIIDPETNAYSDTDFIASCLAMFPAESPSLILYLAIIKPRGDYLGGRIAAPPIREAAEALTDYLGIPRGRNLQIEHSPRVSIGEERIADIGETIPDFSGLSKRSLLPLILRDDIHIEIQGDGWVRRQSPPPGSAVEPGMTIQLFLE
ncbi:MAG: transpeptidase family protein [Treponema sp.]|jgi:cell division protein FtsI (penicillin-binding protein 3)|nr:transpeptidase family protein [Treponema sp.]